MSVFTTEQFSQDVATGLILAFLGFAIAMVLTPLYTALAYRYKFWKKPRKTSVTGETAKVFQKLHAAKHRRHIPTMAGVVTVLSVGSVTFLFNLDRQQTWLPLAAMAGAAAVGLIDDLINIRGVGQGVAGLNSKIKFLLITLVALAGGWYFFYKLGYDAIHIPFVGNWQLGMWLIPIFAFVIVATANAVNISDGLDGLAGGLLTIAFAVYGMIAFLQDNIGIAGFCVTLVGALLAYVWFNIYPARFFMGDVGSFALGTALGVVAMLTNTLALLPIIGLVFVAEAGSALIQILSKKILHRKIFLSAPIHHHLEALGWPETKVTMRFWVIGAVSGVLGLIIALVGGHII
ncbi:MAG TPA: phospho-N-acetylmuramoyl-pentapeptide-transferase [Candidatus Saccharimonadales bacterium]|nr:phospho-N-acetylmuramoyl-pentapeptide-transferase [Candidatus Saccharimonadales bacterium]